MNRFTMCGENCKPYSYMSLFGTCSSMAACMLLVSFLTASSILSGVHSSGNSVMLYMVLSMTSQFDFFWFLVLSGVFSMGM